MKNNSSNNEMSTIGALFWTVVVLIVIGLIISAFSPKCSHYGCDNSPASGSSYCYLHKNYRYNSYNYSLGSSYRNNSSSSSSSSNSTNKSSTQNNNSANKSYSSKSSNSGKKTSDPYGAKDYYDAEDFYYDNYDDFCDYEDAEDYYNDVWDE